MVFAKKEWVDRQTEFPSRRQLVPVGGKPNTYDVQRAEGVILEEGNAFDAKNMNDLERRIADAFELGEEF